jgi:hypothetical protein
VTYDYLQPGDLIIFQGLVAGARGVCLVISVEPPVQYGLQFYYLTSDMRLRRYEADWGSPKFDRISERRARE